MKKHLLILTPILILLLAMVCNVASAQVTTGPSDVTTAAPTAAADAAKILCYGSPISLSGPTDVGGADFTKYHWYKIDPSGVKQEVTAQTGKTYTEASGAAGWYYYQLVTENANGCTSPISDMIKIYVLPQLNVSITTPTTSMCAVASNETLLTAVVTPTGYAVTYQWTRNGTPIAGATSSTYDVTGEIVPATVSFGVTVTYTLNTSCPATNAKDIVITPLPSKPLITAN